MSKIPTVLWAQRKDKLYITVDVQDVKEGHNVKLENVDGHGRLTFSGTAGSSGESYSLALDFYKEVNVEESKVSVSPRSIFLMVFKQAENQEHWPRLTKDSSKHLTHIKCDWNKWVDEDEEDEDKFDPSSQFDFSSLGGMGGGMAGMQNMMGGMGGMGMGGMGGMDFGDMGGDEGDDDEGDSDDEALPDLVK